MEITSLAFFLFALFALGIYYLLPQRGQNYWLLACSYLFIITWAVEFALILLLSTVVNYWLAVWVDKAVKRRSMILWSGIIFNIAAFIFFRLAGFFVSDIVTLLQSLGIRATGESLQILLPVGLSFYVLGNISYLVDVHRKQMDACRDWLSFSLYLAYFPKLLAGPIERARSFLPKLQKPRTVDDRLLAHSIALIFVGIVRKTVIADTIASAMAHQNFARWISFSTVELWLWLFVYAFFIYNDFAGYTGIVRGVSGLFGIELSPNFYYPYFARSFTEFWNRWHISLSNWLRDYIYFPVSRAILRRAPDRYHPINLLVPPMVTMLASGLWHGFSWHMLLWGGLHGIFLIFERLFLLRRAQDDQKQSPLRQVLSMALVFVFVSLAWVPFRLGLPETMTYWSHLFNWTGWSIEYKRVVLLVPFLAVTAIVDWLLYKKEGELTFLHWPRPVRAAAMAAVLFIVIILSQAEPANPFVYQGF